MAVDVAQMQRPTIRDLQATGKPATIIGVPSEEIPTGELNVWIQKPGSEDAEDAYRRANAARARLAQQLENHDSDAYQALLVKHIDWDEEQLRLFIVEAEMQKNEQVLLAEFTYGEDSEWWDEENEMSRIDGIIDSWLGPPGEEGLRERYARDPEDSEAATAFEQIIAYNNSAQEMLDEHRADLTAQYSLQALGALREEVAKLHGEVALNEAFRKALDNALIWVCTRDPKEKWRKHFANFEEVRDLDEDMRRQILTEYASLTVDSYQGKESPAATSSSSDSVSAGPQATGPSSSRPNAPVSERPHGTT